MVHKSNNYSIETQAIHVGYDPASCYGMVNNPIYQSSTIIFPTLADFYEAEGKYKGFQDEEEIDERKYKLTYGRHGTPTVLDLQKVIAQLQGGDFCRITSCGLSAITAAINAFAKAGSHVLISDGVYGPVHKFASEFLTKYGVEIEFYDPLVTYEEMRLLVKDNTVVVFCESPSSLTFEVQDIPGISKAAHEKNAVVIADCCFATPFYFDAFAKGADIVVHSITKFISGHSDFFAGAIIGREKYRHNIDHSLKFIGDCVSPQNAYLALRGIKTLSARLKMHNESLTKVIDFLNTKKIISNILHPSCESCPGHEIWKRDFTGSTSLLSIVLDKKYSDNQLANMLDKMRLFRMGYSWGGFESLMIPFVVSDSRSVSKYLYADRTCLRIYIGLESAEDLIQDLEDGLARLG